MSDNTTEPLPTQPAAAPATAPAVAHAFMVPKKLAYAIVVISAAALLVSGLLWQKLGNIQEELAKRSLDAGAQSIEARTLAKAAQDSTRELAARLALQENRISEVSLQRSQLEELMQSLSRSRDENLVVDIESALRLAQQQAQLTGSAVPLIAAMTSATQRLQRAAQPRLNPLQRALAKDLERIKAASLTDVPMLMIKIDELTRMADDLPVANAMVVNQTASKSTATAAPASGAKGSNLPAMLGWFDSKRLEATARAAIHAVRDEARALLRVSRIEQPEAALLSPEQSFFLRENLKLRLLNARLGLLSRQTDTARADLASASAWLGKYFDQNSRKTQAANQLLQQIQSQLKTSELPRLDETMAALATAAAGR
ncbi:MAG: uroporphyrinogen-III C-methyltransferase [Polaromonas sp.]